MITGISFLGAGTIFPHRCSQSVEGFYHRGFHARERPASASIALNQSLTPRKISREIEIRANPSG
ncbi:MAG TPA: hypothetical protein VFK65_20265 [Candidatus Binatia bacterium]|nr:hypothetical protein [Candidatus Binatia bacterium]